MCPCIARSIVLFGFWIGTSQPVLAQPGPSSQTVDPRLVLEQTKKRLDAISNYQCTYTARIMRWPGGGHPPVISHVDRKQLAYNSQGCGHVREIHEDLSATTRIWDGTRSVEVHEDVRPDGTVVYSASIVPGRYLQVRRASTPWDYLGSRLTRRLATALENGSEISVERTENGYCRLEIPVQHNITFTAILDPNRGYLPIREEMFGQGRRRGSEEIKFKEVGPGIWFPSAVLQSGTPKIRFTNIKINDPDFDHHLVPVLPNGTTVADHVRGVRYVVDDRGCLGIAGYAPQSPGVGSSVRSDGSNLDTSRGPSGAIYGLGANQALKHIAPPLSPSPKQSVLDRDEDRSQVPEAAPRNAVFVLERDGNLRPTVRYEGNAFLTLSEVIQHACEIDLAELSGPEDLLDLRLRGDWVVRRDASKGERLRSLEHIVHEETGMTITFEKQRIDTPVVRVTGILQYHPLAGALGDNDIQLFTETSSDCFRTYTGGGSGPLSQLLWHMTNRTGKRFFDETLSSDMYVSWSDYESSKLAPYDGPRQMYQHALTRLLEHVAKQTGLTFTLERRTIDEWVLRLLP